MRNKILKPMLCLLAACCVILTGCNIAKEGEASPVDTEDTPEVEQSPPEYADITGTWELSDSNNGMVYYLTFEDGGVTYAAYSTEDGFAAEESAGGSCTIEDNGRVIISISSAGEVHENTYSVSVSGDTLTLSPIEDSPAAEGGFSLAGTYVKSSLPVSQEPTGQETDAAPTEAQATDATNTDDTTGSPSAKDEQTASFLAETDYFLAGTDTFLGNAHEDEVTGSFVLFDSDRIEGTFYVSISQTSIGSVNFYIDGDIIYFSNSSMGTYSKCALAVTDTYIQIQQIESDAEGEDLLNTIEGTWYAH